MVTKILNIPHSTETICLPCTRYLDICNATSLFSLCVFVCMCLYHPSSYTALSMYLFLLTPPPPLPPPPHTPPFQNHPCHPPLPTSLRTVLLHTLIFLPHTQLSYPLACARILTHTHTCMHTPHLGCKFRLRLPLQMHLHPIEANFVSGIVTNPRALHSR